MPSRSPCVNTFPHPDPTDPADPLAPWRAALDSPSVRELLLWYGEQLNGWPPERFLYAVLAEFDVYDHKQKLTSLVQHGRGFLPDFEQRRPSPAAAALELEVD